MPSQLAHDPATAVDRPVTELLVLWQHPENRELVPIGRFSNTGATYTFSYTCAAADIADFRPLPGFSDLHQQYQSERMPAILAQRVMHRDRPDYANYVESLGLDPELATPWEQIVGSGGHREGDTLQFMELPSVERGVASARFFVNGIRYMTTGAQHSIRGHVVSADAQAHEQTLRSLTAGSTLLAVPEDGNNADPNAVIVISHGSIPLGWAPRALSSSIRELAAESDIPLTVLRTGQPEGPVHQRLVVEMSVPVDRGFQFDREGRWEPLRE